MSAPTDAIRDWCGAVPAGVRVESGNTGPLRVWLHRADTEPRAIGLPSTR